MCSFDPWVVLILMGSMPIILAGCVYLFLNEASKQVKPATIKIFILIIVALFMILAAKFAELVYSIPDVCWT